MDENEQQVVDLAEVHSRAWLIEQGLQAFHLGKVEDATNYFGAAIRKARKLRYWDVEVEYYRFLTLYKSGDYSRAVQRCVICLDALHETRNQHISKKELPYDLVQDQLESSLLATMARRGDSLMALQSHLRKKHSGEFYLMKKPIPLLQAIQMAWRAPRKNPLEDLETIRNPLRMISTVLLEGVIEEMMMNTFEASGGPVQKSAAATPAIGKDIAVIPEWIDAILMASPQEISVGEERRLCQFIAQNDVPHFYDRLADFLESSTNDVRYPYLRAFVKPQRERKPSKGLTRIFVWIEEAMRSKSWN